MTGKARGKEEEEPGLLNDNLIKIVLEEQCSSYDIHISANDLTFDLHFQWRK